MRRPLKTNEGFTLIEVLMAMIVLGIGIAALLTAMATHASTSALNRNQAASESVLTAAAEYVKSLPFTNNGTHCQAISGSVPTGAVAYSATEFAVTYGPGQAVGGDSLCSIQRVPVNVTALDTTKGFTMSVQVIKRPDIEPTP